MTSGKLDKQRKTHLILSAHDKAFMTTEHTTIFPILMLKSDGNGSKLFENGLLMNEKVLSA